MNSKEALNRLKESAYALEELPASNWVDYYGEKGHLIDNETELELAIDNDSEIIQKDLNRLEKLKKAINIIVEKMGIEIIDNGFTYLKQDSGLIKFLNEEECKLLKEVLCNEK